MAEIVIRAAAVAPVRPRRVAWRGPTGRLRGRPRVHFSPGRGPTVGGHSIQSAAGGDWRCTLCGRFARTCGSKRFLRYSL
eukprot:5829714-Heterocapsa_arctica.AAC.1